MVSDYNPDVNFGSNAAAVAIIAVMASATPLVPERLKVVPKRFRTWRMAAFLVFVIRPVTTPLLALLAGGPPCSPREYHWL